MMHELGPDDRNVLRALRSNRGECPAADALIAYEEMTALERQADPIHDHVQVCSRCQLVLHHLPEPKPEASKSRWFPWILVPAAVALTVAILVPSYFRSLHSPQPGQQDVIRGSNLEPVAPAGTVSSVSSFQWQSPLLAPQYRVNVYRDGALVWSGTGTTTSIAVPSGLRLDPGADYEWEVEARSETGALYLKSRRLTFRVQ